MMTFEQFTSAIGLNHMNCADCRAAHQIFRDMMLAGELKLAEPSEKSYGENVTDEVFEFQENGAGNWWVLKHVGGGRSAFLCGPGQAAKTKAAVAAAIDRGIDRVIRKIRADVIGQCAGRAATTRINPDQEISAQQMRTNIVDAIRSIAA